MVEGGPIDYLTGDYLAELTMALLWRTRQRHPTGGYAHTFLTQAEEVLGACLDKGIRVVVNAGGLNPGGLATDLEQLADRLGLKPRIATVGGDDLLARLDHLGLEPFGGQDPPSSTPITANAYLGCWGIASALDRGADVVVTGRVTDAALVMGPAAHHHDWERDDWDRLAGALVAGHIIECGPQATGGNFSFFQEIPGLSHVGFPIAEVDQDGSCVITKHPGSGGAVTTETVTAQLLYEIGSPRYISPDVTAWLETIRLEAVGPDRVRVSGTGGQPPPPDLKVAVNELGGYRNNMIFVLTGMDIAEKAAAVEEALWEATGGRDSFAATDVRLLHHIDQPRFNDEAMAHLRVTVKDHDREKVGRAFSSAVVSLALAHYPGFFTTAPPSDSTPFAVYRPMRVEASAVPSVVTFEGDTWEVTSVAPAGSPGVGSQPPDLASLDFGATERVPLGRVAGARSGDKGGDANLGIWLRRPEWFGWLSQTLAVDALKELVPEVAHLVVERYELPNLGSLNFVVRGLLGDGVASSVRTDPQAKSLGEFVRSRIVEVPRALLDATSSMETKR